MKVNILKIFALCILSLSFGCSKKIPVSTLNQAQFFDIVYVATQYRAPGETTWFPTSGLYEMKFLQDSGENASAVGGSFSMHYTSYLESNLCPYGQNCVCSGGLTGLFSDAPKPTDPIVAPYDPNSTYNPDGGTATATGTAPTDSSVSTIYTFNFSLSFQANTLTSGCANGHKFNQPLKVYRFSNGDLIVNNDTSQLYMTPEIKKVN